MRKTLLLLLTIALLPLSSAALQPQRGYRGFIDANMSTVPNIGFIAGEPGDSEIYLGLSTSHGYQFNRWLYVGGGAGMEYNPSWKSYHPDDTRLFVPIFAEARADAKWGRFTPFLSMRLGANVADHGGIYFSPLVGYRFNWGRRSAINFGLGITLCGRRYTYEDFMTDQTVSYHGTHVSAALRLGFEFQLP